MSHELRRVALGLTAVVVAVLALAGPAAADPALQEGLVANWSFDETTGTTVHDAMGGANAEWLPTGSMGYGQSWSTGILGGALTFDPTLADSGAYVGNPASLNLGTNACTLQTWVNTTYLPADLVNGFGAIFDSRNDKGYMMYLDKGRNELRLNVHTADSGNNYKSKARPGIAASALTTSAWHHVVSTFDGKFAKIYYDGQLMDTVATDNFLGTQIEQGQLVGIGYEPHDPAYSEPNRNFFTGSLDDMAVWNRALNANEVAYLYNSGAGRAVLSSNPTIAPPTPVTTMPTPVVRLQFDGNLVNSGSGGATYNGTMIDGTLGSTSYEAAKSGQGLRLDNPQAILLDGDCVSVPYHLTKSGTISFWTKPTGPWFNYNALFDNSGGPGITATQEDWEMWIYNDGRVRWRTEQPWDSIFPQVDLDTDGGPDQWHYVTAVWEQAVGSDTASCYLYLNGQLIGGTDGPLVEPGDLFYIAGGNPGNDFGRGVFDDFRIYDVALTPEQVAALYASYTPSIPGDTDGDGDVDNADATKVATNWGSAVTGKAADGDFNEDGVVNSADAAILAANWTGSAEGKGAVPEPSMLVLLLASSAMVLLRRQR
jgi:hypothetical protein